MSERMNGRGPQEYRTFKSDRRGRIGAPDRRYVERLDQQQSDRARVLAKIAERREAELGIGNRELPAFKHKSEYIETLRAYKATIAGGETGSGKSTQFPQFMYEDGYDLTIVMVPRQIIANGLADRLREEMQGFTDDTPTDEVVGVVHGDRTERHENNKILVMTPNTYLKMEQDIREAFGDKRVGIISDEMHEANIFTEIATASASSAVQQHDEWRIVAASATHNSERLKDAFQEINGGYVPTVEIKGRPHQVSIHEKPEQNAMEAYVEVGEAHEKTMIFTSGKKQIEHIIRTTKAKLEDREPGSSQSVVFRSLYRELGSETIARVDDPIPEGHRLVIVSTPAGMSGITIPGLTCVITDATINRSELDVASDTGLESDGIIPEGLRRRYMSQAEIIQQVGRAGRDVEGGTAYIVKPTMARKLKTKARQALKQRSLHEQRYWLPIDDDEFLPLSEREAHAPAEIYNTNLQDVTLSTAGTGRRLYDLRRYLQHRVEELVLLNAEETLVRLGALDDERHITAAGEMMNRIPVIPEIARGLYEVMLNGRSVEQLGRAAVIAATLDVGGLSSFDTTHEQALRRKAFIRTSTADDMIAELDVAIGLQDLERTKGESLSEHELALHGIHLLNYQRSQKVARKILKIMKIKPGVMELTHPLPVEEKELRNDFTAGFLDLIYRPIGKDRQSKKEQYRNILGSSRSPSRTLSNRSNATPNKKMMVAAMPYYYEVGVNKYGRPIKYDVLDRTIIVDTDVVAEHALRAGLVAYRERESRVVDGEVSSFGQGYFGEIKVGRKERLENAPPAELHEALYESVQKNPGDGLRALRSLSKELSRIRTLLPESELESYRRSDAPKDISSTFIDALLREEASKTSFAINVDLALRQYVHSRNLSLSTYYYPEDLEELYRRSPQVISIEGHEIRVLYENGKPYITRLPEELEKRIDGPLFISEGREVFYQMTTGDGEKVRVSFALYSAHQTLNG